MEIGPQGVTYAREKSLVTTDLVHMLRVSGAKPLFTVHYTFVEWRRNTLRLHAH